MSQDAGEHDADEQAGQRPEQRPRIGKEAGPHGTKLPVPGRAALRGGQPRLALRRGDGRAGGRLLGGS
ncbi:MAG: hypothetical protein ACK55I_31905, partial [bacterium]